MAVGDDGTLKEKWRLIPSFLKSKGIFNQHIASFDYFVNHELKNIVKANSRVGSDANKDFYLKYLDIEVGTPSSEEGFGVVNERITPHECRLRDMTYSAPIHVKIEYVRGNQRVTRDHVVIGRLPIMLRSSRCMLSKLRTEEEMAQANECPYDSGGYFIVRGAEKVVLMHEQMSKNRIMISRNTKKELVCEVMSSTLERRSKTHVISKRGLYYVQHNLLTAEIPIAVIFKAMGYESDFAILSSIGREENIVAKIGPSLEHCVTNRILTREDAIRYIAEKVKMRRPPWEPQNTNTREQEAESFLINGMIGHVSASEGNLKMKAIYLGLMIRKLVVAEIENAEPDDRDFYGNKRIELAGSLLALIFEDLLKRFNAELKKIADKSLAKNLASPLDIVKHFRQDLITNGLINALSTGNWAIKRFRMDRQGVTQVLSRLSYMSALSSMTKINSTVEKSRKVSGPRALQASQWGMLCPADTPEGEACGLVKNLALMSHITTNSDEPVVHQLLFDIGMEDVRPLDFATVHNSQYFMVFLNGSLVGLVVDPKSIVRNVRNYRRRGKLDQFLSVSMNESNRSLSVSTDEGRLCRPYAIVEGGKLLLAQQDVDAVGDGLLQFDDLVRQGVIEWLDVNEMNNVDTLIALNEKEIKQETTHMEIEPFTILGVCAALIPYPHHNQSPRNTYQCAMGKQAMGTIGYNQHKRIDSLMYQLVYPEKPLVKTKPLEFCHFEKLPAGQNATVAVMSFSGYDIEDAIILNSASLDRGFGRCLVYRNVKTTARKYINQTYDKLMGPKIEAATGKPIARHEVLDREGLVFAGSKIKPRQVLINKATPKATAGEGLIDPKDQANVEYADVPMSYKGPLNAVADQVVLTCNESDSYLFKVRYVQCRRPEIGDKFSSRHGQKGVCGMIFRQEDLPFDGSGVVPDLIMNPHGYPSRMTVGKLMELLSGKNALMTGRLHYGTAFGGDDVDSVSAELASYGFNYLGKDMLTSGLTGEQISAYIYFGPIYYQKLKHMVLDKMHARAKGPRAALTRQPTEGRQRDGGLRLGEMERDCLIAYGTSALLMERLMVSSDQFDVDVCAKCGLIGYPQWCQFCKSGSEMARIKIPYACKLLFQELQSMNIVPRLITRRDTE